MQEVLFKLQARVAIIAFGYSRGIWVAVSQNQNCTNMRQANVPFQKDHEAMHTNDVM